MAGPAGHFDNPVSGELVHQATLPLCSIDCGQLSSCLSEPPGLAAVQARVGAANISYALSMQKLCTRPIDAQQGLEQQALALFATWVLDTYQAALLHVLRAVTGLMLAVQELAAHIDQAAVLQGLVVDGQQGLAERWAATLAHGQQVALVSFCVEVDRLKEAVRLVKRLRLQQVGAKGRLAGVCMAF